MRDREAGVSLPALGLVGLSDAEHPHPLRSVPDALSTPRPLHAGGVRRAAKKTTVICT